MSVDWRMGCLTVLLVATAIAYTEPSSADDRLDGCKGLPARGRMARYEPVGENAVYAVARSGDRYLVSLQQEGGCEVYAIGRAVARVEGHFGAGSKAFALWVPRCGGGTARSPWRYAARRIGRFGRRAPTWAATSPSNYA